MAHTYAEEPAQPGKALTEALRAASEGASQARQMDLELKVLMEGRRYFMEWIEGLPRGGSHANAAQFLRAWSDATSRVIQLLKARQDLAGEGGDEGLLADLVAELEHSPGLCLDDQAVQDPAPAAARAPEAVGHG